MRPGRLQVVLPLALTVLLLAPAARAYLICVVPAGGLVDCDETKPPSSYTGLEVELLRDIGNLMSLTERGANIVGAPPAGAATDMSSYTFVCTEWYDSIIPDLVVNTTFGDCAMVVGAITVTPTRSQAGVRFAYPHYHTGLAIMIYTTTREFDKWAFFKPFELQTWLAFIFTLVAVPILVWMIEQLCMHGYIVLSVTSLHDMREAAYETMLCIFNLQIYRVRSFAAQVCVLGFCFLVLIMMSTYVAKLSAVLTISTVGSAIKSIDDLRGLAVGTDDTYVDQLNRVFGVVAAAITWNGFDPTYEAVADQFEAGTLAAYIMDDTILAAGVGLDNRDCHISLLADLILPFDYGFAFHEQMPKAVIDAYSLNVLVTQATAVIEALSDRYLVFPSECSNLGSTQTGGVSFKQMSGLWIIMGTCIGFGVLSAVWTMGHHIWLTMRGMNDMEANEEEVFNNGESQQGSTKKTLTQAFATMFIKANEPMRSSSGVSSNSRRVTMGNGSTTLSAHHSTRGGNGGNTLDRGSARMERGSARNSIAPEPYMPPPSPSVLAAPPPTPAVFAGGHQSIFAAQLSEPGPVPVSPFGAAPREPSPFQRPAGGDAAASYNSTMFATISMMELVATTPPSVPPTPSTPAHITLVEEILGSAHSGQVSEAAAPHE